MLALMIAEMGGTEEQAECTAESLGDETENVAALFSMNEEPESEEAMMFLFTFMAAAMECGVDVMEGTDLDMGVMIANPQPAGKPSMTRCVRMVNHVSASTSTEVVMTEMTIGAGSTTAKRNISAERRQDYAEFMGGSLCAETPKTPDRQGPDTTLPPSIGWPFLFVCSDRCWLVVSQFV